jgi:hypothetical protein
VADLLSLTAEDTQVALTQTAAKTGESRLPFLMLAYAAAQAESNLDCIGRRYAYKPAFAVRWLTVLPDLGYPLSEVEQHAAADGRRQAEEDAVADEAIADVDGDTD